MKEIYQSKDGKLFNTEQECEIHNKTLNSNLILLDCDGYPLNAYNNDSIKNFMYCYIGDEKNLIYIKKKGQELNVDVPNEIGYWYFDNIYSCKYKKIDNQISKHNEWLNSIKESLSELKERSKR